MNYYIQGDAANADQIKAAFEKLGIASNADRYNYKNDNVLYFTAGGMIHMTDANGAWANIIKTHPDYKELPVEPKFKVGDWVVTDYGKVSQVVSVDNAGDGYTLDDGVYFSGSWCDMYHLWTIADAKDGDVLALNGKPFIYSSHKYGKNYCYIDEWGQLRVNFSLVFEGNYVCPATKQERDLLFSKMREVGYDWDADKKELHKIQPHYDISNFNPFDKVLVRCSNDEEWMIEFYCKYDTLVHTSPHRDYPFMGIGDSYSQCIPFEGNEHLLGTTDMCDEMYINW